MSRINVCPACNAQKHGIKSRIAYEHTCGREPETIKVMTKKDIVKSRAEAERSRLFIEGGDKKNP